MEENSFKFSLHLVAKNNIDASHLHKFLSLEIGRMVSQILTRCSTVEDQDPRNQNFVYSQIVSDQFPVWLGSTIIRQGPRCFGIQNMWLGWEGFNLIQRLKNLRLRLSIDTAEPEVFIQ